MHIHGANKCMYHSVPHKLPPCIFSEKSCRGIFIPHIREDSSLSQNIGSIFKPLGCLLLKLPTTNADRPHQQWTHQLLRGSTLLASPSMLKLVSLLLASRASLHLVFYARPQPYPIPTMRSFFRKGGCNRERKCHIACISPPPCTLY